MLFVPLAGKQAKVDDHIPGVSVYVGRGFHYTPTYHVMYVVVLWNNFLLWFLQYSFSHLSSTNLS